MPNLQKNFLYRRSILFNCGNSENCDNLIRADLAVCDAYNGEIYSEDWLPDTGVGHHVTPDFQNLSIFNESKIQINLELVMVTVCILNMLTFLLYQIHKETLPKKCGSCSAQSFFYVSI